jgi:protein-L-isoaspartate(D-aspartate) O-methyltransferase
MHGLLTRFPFGRKGLSGAIRTCQVVFLSTNASKFTQQVHKAIQSVPNEVFTESVKEEASYTGEYNYLKPNPNVAAKIAELAQLRKYDRVLEIGTGSGYLTSLLAELVPFGKVVSTEINPELHKRAKSNIEKLGYKNIELVQFDGASFGFSKYGPYDVIVFNRLEIIPEPMKQQLVLNGRLIFPARDKETGAIQINKLTKVTDNVFGERETKNADR